MSEPLEFEVRPIEGISVAVGEEVTFREEDGKLLALNEDGEAFGSVPRAFASKLQAMGLTELEAKVTGRSYGVPTVAVTVPAAGETAGTTNTEEAQAEGASADAGTASVTQAPETAAETKAACTTGAQAPGAPEGATPAEAQAAPDTAQSPQQPSAASGNVGQSYEQFLADDTAGENAAAAQAQEKPRKKTGKRIAIIVLLVVALLFVGCVALLAVPTTQTVTYDWMSVEVPADWTVNEEEEEDTVYLYPDDCAVVVHMGTIYEGEDVETVQEELEDAISLMNKFGDTWGEREELAIGDAVVWRYEVTTEFDDKVYAEAYGTAEWQGYYEVVFSGDEYKVLTAYCLADEYDEHADELLEIMDSLTLENPTAPGESLEDGGSDGGDTETETQTVSNGTISVEVPASWDVVEDEDGNGYSVGKGNGDVAISVKTEEGILDGTTYGWGYAEGILLAINSGEEDENGATAYVDTDSLEESTTDEGVLIRTYDYSEATDEIEYDGSLQMIFSGDSLSTVIVACYSGVQDEYEEQLETILSSVTVENPEEPLLWGVDSDSEDEEDGTAEETEEEFEETTLFDEGGITITATGVSEDWSDVCVDVTISNESERTITISANDDFSIGDTMTDVWLYTTVASGKVAYEQIEFYDVDSVDELTEFSGTLQIYDDDTYDTLYEPEISMSFE